MSQNTWKTTHIVILKTLARYGPIISPSHNLLLFILAGHGNPDGTGIFVRMKTLAELEGHSVQWTRKLLRDLEKEGFIVAVDKKGGRGRFAQYELCLTKLGIAILPTNSPQNELTPPEMPQTQIIAPIPFETNHWARPNANENVLHWQDVVQREQFGLDEALKRGDEVYAARRREKLKVAQEKLALAESEL